MAGYVVAPPLLTDEGGLLAPAIWRTRRQPLTGIASVLLAIFAVTAVIAATGRASAAQPVAGSSYVKYYVVAASFQGKPENLAEIAGRFLGGTSRSNEIFQLNAGVQQRDGGKLTDPAVLHAGWVLVLPWTRSAPACITGCRPRRLRRRPRPLRRRPSRRPPPPRRGGRPRPSLARRGTPEAPPGRARARRKVLGAPRISGRCCGWRHSTSGPSAAGPG